MFRGFQGLEKLIFFEHYSVSCAPCPKNHESVDPGGGGGRAYIYIYTHLLNGVYININIYIYIYTYS